MPDPSSIGAILTPGGRRLSLLLGRKAFFQIINIFGGFFDPRLFNSGLNMNDSQALLAEYIKTGSDTAFRELVARDLDLVYSTALRLVAR